MADGQKWTNGTITTGTAWSTVAKGNLEYLWSATVQPWGLDEPWLWDNTPDNVDNTSQE